MAGNAFGLSEVSAGTISLSIFILLLIWHYRYIVEIRMRTWLVLAIALLAAASAILMRHQLASFFLERSITRATGIYDYAPHANEAMPKIGKLIDGSDHNILFSGVNFYISLPQYKDRLLNRLKSGVTVRFLIFNHLSPNLGEVAAGFNQKPEELKSECEITVENLKTLMEQAKIEGATGTLEIRFFDTPPRTRMYVFDREKHEGTTFFIPHIDRQNSAQLPGFFTHNIPNGVASEYFAGVDRLWASALRWNDFLDQIDKK